MNPIDKQVEILNKLTQLMHDSTNGVYEEMQCNFEYEPYDGGWSVGSRFSFVRQGTTVSELLDDPDDTASDLVHELHEVMKKHTGGDWKSFVLSVDPTGKAHTKFAYP